MGYSLILAGALATAAVAGSTVEPTTGWRPMPALAEPAELELAQTELTGQVTAWGDPATGRFALRQDYVSVQPVANTAEAIANVHASLRASLEADGATIDAWQSERGESNVELRLGTFRAKARTLATIEPTGKLRATSVLCFFNARDRDRSEQKCNRLLDSL